jgi:hypothetical protein
MCGAFGLLWTRTRPHYNGLRRNAVAARRPSGSGPPTASVFDPSQRSSGHAVKRNRPGTPPHQRLPHAHDELHTGSWQSRS